MTQRTGRGAGRPPKQPVELSDASLLSIAVYFLKQMRNRPLADPAIMYLTSSQEITSR